MKITLTVSIYVESESGDLDCKGFGSSETFESRREETLAPVAEALAKALVGKIREHRIEKK